MNRLADICSGIDQAVQSLAEGWQQLRQRAAHALTRFNPVHRTTSTKETTTGILEANASRWALLAAEVHEDADSVCVKIEVPGMEADDFDIQVIDNALVVSGEKRAESERKEGRFQIMECAYGSFERVIPLTAAVNEQQAKAKYKRGVLTITLPKLKTAGKNRITIN